MRKEINKEVELYKQIGTWVNYFHWRTHVKTGLLKDFQHDVWLKLRDLKEINESYIKTVCKFSAYKAMVEVYRKKNRDGSEREIVLLNEEGGYEDFADMPSTEVEVIEKAVVPNSAKGKKPREVRVTFLNGETEDFLNAKSAAETLEISVKNIYKCIKTPLQSRYTNRKISHVKTIQYL